MAKSVISAPWRGSQASVSETALAKKTRSGRQKKIGGAIGSAVYRRGKCEIVP